MFWYRRLWLVSAFSTQLWITIRFVWAKQYLTFSALLLLLRFLVPWMEKKITTITWRILANREREKGKKQFMTTRISCIRLYVLCGENFHIYEFNLIWFDWHGTMKIGKNEFSTNMHSFQKMLCNDRSIWILFYWIITDLTWEFWNVAFIYYILDLTEDFQMFQQIWLKNNKQIK